MTLRLSSARYLLIRIYGYCSIFQESNHIDLNDYHDAKTEVYMLQPETRWLERTTYSHVYSVITFSFSRVVSVPLVMYTIYDRFFRLCMTFLGNLYVQLLYLTI